MHTHIQTSAADLTLIMYSVQSCTVRHWDIRGSLTIRLSCMWRWRSWVGSSMLVGIQGRWFKGPSTQWWTSHAPLTQRLNGRVDASLKKGGGPCVQVIGDPCAEDYFQTWGYDIFFALQAKDGKPWRRWYEKSRGKHYFSVHDSRVKPAQEWEEVFALSFDVEHK